MRFTRLLRHGLVAGAAAGLSAALMLWAVVEPVIGRALMLEEARRPAGHTHDEPLVSRSVQVAGGAAAAVLVGLMVGVVFAVVFARARHRLPGATDLARAGWLAVLGFVVVTLLPALKTPANPPGVGDPATVVERTLLYLLTILLGVLAVGLVMDVDRRLSDRGTVRVTRAAVGAVLVLACVAVVLAVVPGAPDRVPPDVPASLLWDFRMASLAQLATTWLTLGLVFGGLVDSGARRRRAPMPVEA